LVLSRVRLIRVRLVLVNLNPINDTYMGLRNPNKQTNKQKLVVGTGFWTSILSPVFWAGLSQITLFCTYRIPAAIPVFKRWSK